MSPGTELLIKCGAILAVGLLVYIAGLTRDRETRAWSLSVASILTLSLVVQ